MKKFLLILVTALFFLGACSNGDQENTSNGTDGNEENNTEENVNNEKKENERTESSEDATDETELYDIKLNAESNAVELTDPQGKVTVLSDNAPSEPVKSPNGQMAAYISPIEWEELGNLYIVDLKTGTQRTLVEGNSENKPKNVIWQDDEHVLAIIGYPYGTVSTGGNIYRINAETAEQEALTNYSGETQITDFYIENGVLHYSGIQYTDEDMIEHKEYSNQIELK